jgi:hypothetical protein
MSSSSSEVVNCFASSPHPHLYFHLPHHFALLVFYSWYLRAFFAQPFKGATNVWKVSKHSSRFADISLCPATLFVFIDYGVDIRERLDLFPKFLHCSTR